MESAVRARNCRIGPKGSGFGLDSRFLLPVETGRTDVHARCAIVTDSENGRVDHRQGSALTGRPVIAAAARQPNTDGDRVMSYLSALSGRNTSPEVLRVVWVGAGVSGRCVPVSWGRRLLACPAPGELSRWGRVTGGCDSIATVVE